MPVRTLLQIGALLSACLALAAFRQDEAEPEKPAAPLVVTYLANEGVLLTRGGTSVVIDGFLSQPYGQYAGLSDQARELLLDGQAPFDDLDLALASHVHPDHFQAGFARRALNALPRLAFASSDQVVEALLENLGEDDPLRVRAKAFLPEPGKWGEARAAGVRVRAFRLPHAGNRPTIQNLAQLIDVDGIQVLHCGDGDLRAELLSPFELDERAVDVALVPYWWLLSERGAQLVQEHIAPRVLMAVHVPPRDAEEVTGTIAKTAPGALVLTKPLATHEVSPASEK